MKIDTLVLAYRLIKCEKAKLTPSQKSEVGGLSDQLNLADDDLRPVIEYVNKSQWPANDIIITKNHDQRLPIGWREDVPIED